MSSLAWIDFDEAERQRAQRIMSLFQERESRDELGLGGIRDSIADHLFPGTSTIQTRLRYMLFIPWWGWYATLGPLILMQTESWIRLVAVIGNELVGLVIGMALLQLYLERVAQLEAKMKEAASS